MLTRFNRKTAAVLSGVAASLLIVLTSAQAQERPVVVYGEQSQGNSERVPYGDLDLAASVDRATLYSRVGSAVRNVCKFDAVGTAADYRNCASGTWKDARAQIDLAVGRAGRLALDGGPAGGAILVSSRSR